MQYKERIERFVEELWQWYAHHKRTLPWRDLAIEDDTQRAYTIFVSEVMLQQTQVPRVQVIFRSFLEKFPTIQDLARASNRDVLIAWRGMGYNRRALQLRNAARHILARAENSKFQIPNSKQVPNSNNSITNNQELIRPIIFPKDMRELLQVPGIGPYTAAAIRNFAFNLSTPCIDTNIRRILHRTFVGPENRDGTWKKDDTYLLKLAREVLRIALGKSEIRNPKSERNPRGKNSKSVSDFVLHVSDFRHTAAQWHAALMDFGSLVCTKRSPKCAQCPLSQGICRSAFNVCSRVLNNSITHSLSNHRREPGRQVGGRFVPNRIFRGKVIDLLRDHPQGLTLEAIGRDICLDWSKEHRLWFRKILQSLCRDSLLQRKRVKYVLS